MSRLKSISWPPELSDWLEMKVSPHDADDFHDITEGAPIKHRRSKVCIAQIKEFLDVQKTPPPNWSRTVGKALRKCGWDPKPAEHFPGYGKPKVYKPNGAVKGKWYLEDRAAKNKADDDDEIDDLV